MLVNKRYRNGWQYCDANSFHFPTRSWFLNWKKKGTYIVGRRCILFCHIFLGFSIRGIVSWLVCQTDHKLHWYHITTINQYIIRHGSNWFYIFSDSWKTYADLQQHGFKRNQVKHKYNFVNPNSKLERMCGFGKIEQW